MPTTRTLPEFVHDQIKAMNVPGGVPVEVVGKDTEPDQVLLDVAACQAWLDRRLITV